MRSLKAITHWGSVTHICVGKLTIIGSDNGLSPGRRQAIIWTNDGILLIEPLGTKFCEILIAIHTFSLKNKFENVVCEMAAILSRLQCDKLIVSIEASKANTVATMYAYWDICWNTNAIQAYNVNVNKIFLLLLLLSDDWRWGSRS